MDLYVPGGGSGQVLDGAGAAQQLLNGARDHRRVVDEAASLVGMVAEEHG